jgi:hypothetical protein
MRGRYAAPRFKRSLASLNGSVYCARTGWYASVTSGYRVLICDRDTRRAS